MLFEDSDQTTKAQADLSFQWAHNQSSSKCFAGSFMLGVVLCVLYADINCLHVHVHVICSRYASVNTSRISVSGCEYAEGYAFGNMQSAMLPP